MIEHLFIRVLNMSLTGSFVILAVILLRLFLNRVPKFFRIACGRLYCSGYYVRYRFQPYFHHWAH